MEYGTDFWVNHLLRAVPEFEDAYNEHLREYDGELLTHLLIADFRRYLISEWRTDPASELTSRGLAFLEAAVIVGDELVQEAILVSVLENMDNFLEEHERATFRSMFGSNLVLADAEIKRFWNDMYTTRFRPPVAADHVKGSPQ